MRFIDGFEKVAAAPVSEFGKLKKSLGKVTKQTLGDAGHHLKRYRRDYLMGGAAAGALGTAYGSNTKKNK